MHLRPLPSSQENICAQAACNQSYYFNCVEAMSNSLGWFLHAIPCRLREFSYTVGNSDPTQLPPKDLVDHSAVCILHLEAHVSSVICAYHSAMDSSCWSTQQFKVWQPVFNTSCWLETYDNMTTSSFFSSCISFVVVIVEVFISKN